MFMSEIFYNFNWQEGSKYNYVGNSCMYRYFNFKYWFKV